MELFDHLGRRVVLGVEMRRGGEGAIHRLPGGEVAKVYHPACRTPERAAKVAAMLGNPPHDPTFASARRHSIAWPMAGLFEESGARRFVGFRMPAVQGIELHRVTSTATRLRLVGGTFNWRYLYTVALNLALVVEQIHAVGHRIGDIRESNVLAYSDARVALIDCDSFQVRDRASGRMFYCRVGTPDFLPPEAEGVDFSARDYDRYQGDTFGLGVLLFQLLMEGFSPYASVLEPGLPEAPEPRDKILLGRFAYSGRHAGVRPPPGAPPFGLLSPALQHLFLRCFEEGHRVPSRRPSAAEWREALTESSSRLAGCPANENHWHLATTGDCPWCRLRERHPRGQDPFPGPPPAPRKRLPARLALVAGSRRVRFWKDGPLGQAALRGFPGWEYVAPVQARILRGPGGFLVAPERGAPNPLLHNESRLGTTMALEEGDVLRVGPLRLRVEFEWD